MATREQVLTVDEDSSPASRGQCEKVFTPSTVVFNAGLEAN
ncbi:hypothetical protein HNQ77_001723 [Silvibacterium bohemicum]|jgi:hypothetical protein|uniref:Uncharacterized protein n=1 Tax=Silvibacterium bohemicum TaxID=1577686 RepID=A0A841K0K0_9BACT|nr:hypothetical protein [Silvibacterium bohemicum]MBB6143774.1 hypothetical protein [Silvibacterium bohemicum]